MHKSILERRETKNWRSDAGKNNKLSYEKMRTVMNQKHPRVMVDGEPQQIPMSIDTGSLLSSSGKELHGIDNLGIAVSIYFKLLKSIITFFMVCSVFCIPIYFVYSCGNVSLQATSTWQEYLSEWTLGNVGESSYQCKQRDLKIYDTIELWCPAGSKITAVEKFGLQ
jgi:hypothetical protein